MNQPHFVRFAQALALVTGLAGASAGCGGGTTSGTDSGSGGNDSGGGGNDAAMVADGGEATDAATTGDTGTATDAGEATDSGQMADAASFDCSTCDCGLTATDAGLPLCMGDAIITCGCAAVGPLAPPDLMV